MNIIAYTTSYWNTPEEALVRCEGGQLDWETDSRTGALQLTHRSIYKGYFSLRRWMNNVQKWFNPVEKIISCGTWSEPSWCSLDGVVIVNSGVEPDRPVTPGWDYSKCAFTAAMAFILNRKDWDIAIHLTDDWIVGNVNWNSLLREFADRRESVLSTQWFGRMDWPIAMKRSAAVSMLHSRLRANLTEDTRIDECYLELEQTEMFRDSWWNPWPEVKTIRRDFGHPGTPDINDEETLSWPFVRLPNPDYISIYESTQTALAKPYVQD